MYLADFYPVPSRKDENLALTPGYCLWILNAWMNNAGLDDGNGRYNTA
ncbi:hypothetical protein [Pseudocitrobacter cyperus]|uniref:Uncharacterized protein n=1 Tax=Pseudocitrobacter cyperus TaxID=3112843 RepID=A0ABV0HK92_9ENTR